MTLLLVVSMLPLSMTQADAASKMKLNYKKVTLNVGKTRRLKVKGTKKKVKWKSSKKSVATVSKKGVVKAKKKGTTTITAQIGKKKLRCKVVVKKISNSDKSNKKYTYVGSKGGYPKFSYTGKTITKGESIDLTDYVTGVMNFTKSEKAALLKWTSSDNSIISVDKYGIATGKKAGSAKITCKIKAYSGWKSSTNTLKVSDMDGVSVQINKYLSNQNKYEQHLKYLKAYGYEIMESDKLKYAFDTVKVTIQNSSSSDIVLDSQLLHKGLRDYLIVNGDEPSLYLHTPNHEKETIKAGTTSVVTYVTEDLCSFWSVYQNPADFRYFPHNDVDSNDYGRLYIWHNGEKTKLIWNPINDSTFFN